MEPIQELLYGSSRLHWSCGISEGYALGGNAITAGGYMRTSLVTNNLGQINFEMNAAFDLNIESNENGSNVFINIEGSNGSLVKVRIVSGALSYEVKE
jgi:hypothetical protein